MTAIDSTSTSTRARSSGVRRTYVIGLPLNLLLGCACVFPLALAQIALMDSVFESYGWTGGDGNVDEGLGFAWFMIGICLAGVSLLFLSMNLVLILLTARPGPRYWVLSVLVLLAPFCLAAGWPSGRHLLGWI